ncbi:YbhB/YbcL family Raf kinase inhibitor-like protein [Microvirga sp. W0021]|uniref:YbhB/YbcL family Raf kinase inhibitor-like protein n=1 Tax=Hohaiivirga grylli TaxID=3133970 RepID=A0ABV0BH30_9HYPH
MFKKILFYVSSMLAVLVVSQTVYAQDFTLMVKGEKNAHFGEENILSSSYNFGCSGGNLSPRISWSGVPKETKSLVLTVYDKDAPTGIGWMHWVVINISPDQKELPEGISLDRSKLPQGAMQTRTDYGKSEYGGPCPPQGRKHEYIFTLTALDIERLPEIVTEETSPAMVGYFTKAHAIGEAKTSIWYSR